MVYLFPALLAKYYLGQFLLRTGSGLSEHYRLKFFPSCFLYSFAAVFSTVQKR